MNLPLHWTRLRHGRLPALLAVVLAGAVAGMGPVGSVSAAVFAAPRVIDAPIHAFGWPVSGTPNDPLFARQTDLATIGVPAAWAQTTGDASVIVAVLDTGLDAANPEFAGRVVPGFNAITGVADTATDFSPTNDDNGHGTLVSGVIAARANDGVGTAGIAPGVSLMPIKVLDASGSGQFSTMVAGVDWAIAHGARILTLSLGGALVPEAIAAFAPPFAAAYASGAVVVAAAGNAGAAVDDYPCNFSHVICVGSTTSGGSAVSTFSNRTAALDLVAPGESIVSTMPGGQYGIASGTSFAAPHVTGTIALMRTLAPTLSVDAITTDLEATARPLATTLPDVASGYGLLEAGAAVDRVAAGATTASLAIPAIVVPRLTALAPRSSATKVSTRTRIVLSVSTPVSVGVGSLRLLDVTSHRWIAVTITYSPSTGRLTLVPRLRLSPHHRFEILVSGLVSTATGTPMTARFASYFSTGSI
ncbi:MAG: S8 family peptidase [Candidatus Limnocylindrales bacterium]